MRSAPRLWLYGVIIGMIACFLFIVTQAEIRDPFSLGSIVCLVLLAALFIGFPIWLGSRLKIIVLDKNNIFIQNPITRKSFIAPKSGIRGYLYYQTTATGFTIWQLEILLFDGKKIVITSLSNHNSLQLKHKLEAFPDLIDEIKNQYQKKS